MGNFCAATTTTKCWRLAALLNLAGDMGVESVNQSIWDII